MRYLVYFLKLSSNDIKDNLFNISPIFNTKCIIFFEYILNFSSNHIQYNICCETCLIFHNFLKISLFVYHLLNFILIRFFEKSDISHHRFIKISNKTYTQHKISKKLIPSHHIRPTLAPQSDTAIKQTQNHLL